MGHDPQDVQARWLAKPIQSFDPHSPAYAIRLVLEADSLADRGRQPSAASRNLYREAVDHPDVDRRTRGHAAATLGWTLLHHDPVDPVPAESRRMRDIAVATAAAHPVTRMLDAYLLVVDGRPEPALRQVHRARTAMRPDGITTAQLACLEALARAALGRRDQALTLRGQAAATWPECDLLPVVDQALVAESGT